MLRLRTLGGLSVGNAVSIGSAATQRRPLALLALLAVDHHGLSRDKIIGLLWPESDAEHGRNSLSQLLSLLRRELNADDVVKGAAELRLNPAVIACDVIEFEERIAADDLETAVGLYTGPFLDGVFLRNTPEFEHWVDQERSRLQHVFGDALERLALRASADGDHVSAVRFWRQRASLAPGDSRAALKLMESMVASGDPAGALDQYRAHHGLLGEELGIEPDVAAVEFAAALRGGVSRSMDTPNELSTGIGESATVRRATNGSTPTDSASRNESVPRERLTATPTGTVRRQRSVAIVVAALVVAGATALWGANSGRFGVSPPKPPTHDSLRLRVVTTSAQSDPADSTLALRVRNTALAEMARDPWLFVVTPEAWVAQAPLIGLDNGALAHPDTIRKYARKVRTHVIVDFVMSRVSNGLVITAEARSASTDSSLGVIAEAAAGVADVPQAMTNLGRALRHRIVTARSGLRPTRWSLNATDQPAQAIALFVEGRSEASRGNFIESARRHEAAVRVDSTFAQAWRYLHSSLANAGLSVDDQLHAISAAFRFSNRVRAPFYRLEMVAAYYRAIGDPERALVFYDSIERIEPTRNVNAGISYLALRRYNMASRGYRRFAESVPKGYINEGQPNLVSSLLDESRIAEADSVVAVMVRTDPVHARTLLSRANVFTALRDWDSLSAVGRLQLSAGSTATDSSRGLQWMGSAAIGRGQFGVFDSMATLTARLVASHGSSGDYLAGQLQRAQFRATLAGDTARARAIADSGLAVAPWQSLKQMDRPYFAMLLYLASVRDVERGAAIAREWTQRTPAEFKGRDSLNVLVGRGEMALASGDAREALRLFRIADVRGCVPCYFARYARAFDALSERDSARIWFERYAKALYRSHVPGDVGELAHTYLRLGELYGERNDARAAIKWYERFTTLLATSDTPVLQERVRVVRGRVDSLRNQARGAGRSGT